MQRIALKMKRFKGFEAGYKKRQDELWDEMKLLLHEAGIKDFSIFLDKESYSLFAYLTIEDAAKQDALPADPVQKKWWAFMKDIMETNSDNSPVRTPLK